MRKSQRLAREDSRNETKLRYTFPGRHAHVDSFLAKEFVRHLPKGSTLRFLDMGVAPGQKGAVTTLEAVKKFRLVGASVEAHAVDKDVPDSIAGSKSLGVHYHRLNVEEQALPVNNADIIRASNLLKYVSDKKAVREKIVAALREGGLYVETSYPQNFGLDVHGHWAITMVLQKREGRLVPIQLLPSAPPAQVTGLERPPSRRFFGRSAKERLPEWWPGYRKGTQAAKQIILPQVEENAKALGVSRLREKPVAREEARRRFVEMHGRA
ncbi:hypothetical protein H0O03_03985 [Candidatus Micrarchaeota archaeon]|nr:hypothetical protein [Candidatus Micrarchaeota archaeon]